MKGTAKRVRVKTLFQPELLCRDFGRSAVSVGDLKAWAAKIGATLPAVVPDLAGFDVAHLESLLCAFERAVPALPDSSIADVAGAIPAEGTLRSLIDEGDTTIARWLVGADVHSQWRDRLRAAIEAGELRAIDVLTGLPAARNAELQAPAAVDLASLATPAELLDAFPRWLKAEWFDNLSDRAWLRNARRYKGKSGRNGAAPLFCPFAVMRGLMTSTRGERLPQVRGWHILREKFPAAHAAHKHERPGAQSVGDE